MVRSGCGRAREGSEPDAQNSWRIIRASGRSWPMPPCFIWRGANGSRRSSLLFGEASRFPDQAVGVPFAFFQDCSILGRGNFNSQRTLMALVRSFLIAAVVASLICFAAAQQNSTAVAKYEPALDVTAMDRR